MIKNDLTKKISNLKSSWGRKVLYMINSIKKHRLFYCLTFLSIAYILFFAYAIVSTCHQSFSMNHIIWLIIDIPLFFGITHGMFFHKEKWVEVFSTVLVSYNCLSFGIENWYLLQYMQSAFAGEKGWAHGLFAIFMFLVSLCMLTALVLYVIYLLFPLLKNMSNLASMMIMIAALFIFVASVFEMISSGYLGMLYLADTFMFLGMAVPLMQVTFIDYTDSAK